jgi:hypothetical protein
MNVAVDWLALFRSPTFNSLTGFLWLSLNPLRKILGQYLKIEDEHILPHSSFIPPSNQCHKINWFICINCLCQISCKQQWGIIFCLNTLPQKSIQLKQNSVMQPGMLAYHQKYKKKKKNQGTLDISSPVSKMYTKIC